LKEIVEHLDREGLFEEGLERGQYRFDQVYSGKFFNEWLKPLHHTQRDIYQATSRSKTRVVMAYTPEMLATIKRTRREKIANKTWELERRRRGEVLGRTIRRRNKGPPAHV